MAKNKGKGSVKVPHTELSPDVKCECGQAIKVNVCMRIKRRPLQCYRCSRGEKLERRLKSLQKPRSGKPRVPRQKKEQTPQGKHRQQQGKR